MCVSRIHSSYLLCLVTLFLVTNAITASASEVIIGDVPAITNGPIQFEGITSYNELDGRQKRDFLFQAIEESHYGSMKDCPDVVMGLFRFMREAKRSFHEGRLPQTLTRNSDEFEEARFKVIHTFGTSAKVKFVPTGNGNFTGLWQDEAHGIARFSYAGPTGTPFLPFLGIGVVPGLGLKFPLPGENPSLDMVVMHSLSRQQPWPRLLSNRSHNSVFQEEFSNILPRPPWYNIVMRIVNRRFEQVVSRGNGLHQPVTDFATYRVSGEREATVNSPFRVIFVPTEAARRASDPTIDFRADLAANIPEGTTIYQIYALTEQQERAVQSRIRNPTLTQLREGGAVLIGSIQTESPFFASEYGDFRLFIRHNREFLREEFRP